MTFPSDLSGFAEPGSNRFEMWGKVLANAEVRTLAEVGVWRGEFAESTFSRVASITSYYLIDPWQKLPDWNKPANVSDIKFDKFLQETLDRTEQWKEHRTVLRGRTVDVVDQIDDRSLDFAYIDGDHSLRGITLDLNKIWPKVRDGGLVGGDDFTPSMWQHDRSFEPSGVFPYAVYFAEMMDAPIEALPGNQFAIHKGTKGFSFTDHTGRYPDVSVKAAIEAEKLANSS